MQRHGSPLKRLPVAVALLITMIAVVTPFAPRMPTAGLDNSWMLAMNDAISRRLPLGEAVLFSFGPYAALYTRVFHPDLDLRICLAGLLVGVQCFICFAGFAAGRSRIGWLAFGFAFIAFAYSLDAILICAVLLAGLYAWRLAQTDLQSARNGRATMSELLSVVWVFAVLGLLTLVKVTLITLGGPMVVLAAGVLLQGRRLDLALTSVVAFVAGITGFWLLSGQRLDSLPLYFLSSIDIIAGYSDAMSMRGKPVEVIAFWIVAILALVAIAQYRSVSRASRWWLAAIVGLVLMTASKSGFVRHDFHATIAAAALCLTVVALRVVIATRMASAALIAVLCTAVYFDGVYVQSSLDGFIARLTTPFEAMWEGTNVRVRGGVELKTQYDRALDALKAELPIASMDGTTDIYSSDQAHLIASGNRWNPRPVLQSYLAYTADLAEINRKHLAGANAPDHVLVRIEPIDGHLPLSEDGASWPELLSRYTPTALTGDLVHLDRRGSAAPIGRVGGEPKTHGFDERIALHESAPIEFLQLDIRPTWLGRLVSFLFRIDSPHLLLELRDGTTRDFRLVTKSAAAGFIVSPVVENAREVLQLYVPGTLFAKQVRSLTVQFPADATHLERLFWHRRFGMTSSSLTIDNPIDLATVMPMDRMSDESPAPASTVADCLGSIDLLNDQHDFSRLVTGGLLKVDGWMDQRSAALPSREVFVTLTDAKGNTRFVATHATPRPDVATYLNRPELSDAGYAATADLSAFEGPVTVGMAFLGAGRFVRCRQFAVPMEVRH